MPKIIENLKEKLLLETKKQICENGYARTTVRSVAKGCGVGVGTVYNYFPSKEMLIASFMAEDWNASIDKMKCSNGSSPEIVLHSIYDNLKDFIVTHSAIFNDREAAKVFAAVFTERHKQLRDQLVELILPICENSDACDKLFLAEFIAESILTWTVDDRSFDVQYSVLSHLFK